MSQVTLDEIKQELISFLYNFHDKEGLLKPYDYSLLYDDIHLIKNISKGKFDAVMEDLKLETVIDIKDKTASVHRDKHTLVSMTHSYFKTLTEKSDQLTEATQETITLPQHEDITQSITQITDTVIKNNEVSDETRNIAENLKKSANVIKEKDGKVLKRFIAYIKKCLQALYNFIISIGALSESANTILGIIEQLTSIT